MFEHLFSLRLWRHTSEEKLFHIIVIWKWLGENKIWSNIPPRNSSYVDFYKPLEPKKGLMKFRLYLWETIIHICTASHPGIRPKINILTPGRGVFFLLLLLLLGTAQICWTAGGIIALLKGIPTVVWRLFHFPGTNHKWLDHLPSLRPN